MKIKIIRQKVIEEKGLGVLMDILVNMFPHYKEGEKDSTSILLQFRKQSELMINPALEIARTLLL